MFAFILRRLIGMVAVLFAVSMLVFIVFILVPGGDPAERMAGKNPTPENIQNIREKWGFDQPFYVQYAKMMQKAANGLMPGQHSEYDILRSFDTRQDVAQEIVKGIPATFSLCIGAGIIWLVFGVLVGVISAVTAGQASDRLITTLGGSPETGERKELVFPRLERVAPELALPRVEIPWTPRELESLADLASREPANPTETLIRAMRG